MRRMFLLVLLSLIAVPVVPASAEPSRVAARLVVGPEAIVIAAPALLPFFGPLGAIRDINLETCFGQSIVNCNGQGTIDLLQGPDFPFFVAGVFREVVATGAMTPVSFPVTLQPGQRLNVLFQWAADRLGTVNSNATLQSTPTGGIPRDFEFELRGTATPPADCVPASGVLCLKQGRFTIRGHYLTPTAQDGDAQGVSLTTDTGYLWFFDPSNAEAMIKVLDACGLNNRFWVFAGGLTNVRTLLTVTDTQQDAVKIYINPQSRPFQPIQDTSAFATCP